MTRVAREAGPMWRQLVTTAVGGAVALTGDVTVVGHSGAGAFLPSIAGELEDRASAPRAGLRRGR